MYGGDCPRPAAHRLTAQLTGDHHRQPVYWLVCDHLECLAAAHLNAENIGTHLDLRPIREES